MPEIEPKFLTRKQVEQRHRTSLAEFGGIDGLRDEHGFLSALDAPLNDYSYGGADLFGIAATYAFHIAQAQAFLDGNKRTAVAAALTFLRGNGVVIATVDSFPLHEALIAVAERRMTKAELADRFRALFGEPGAPR